MKMAISAVFGGGSVRLMRPKRRKGWHPEEKWKKCAKRAISHRWWFRTACRNVRTKLTKYTKSGFGRHFCRDGDDLPFYDRPGVGVSLVVKTAQSRGRLSAPWLRDDFCSPQAHPCCGQTCSVTLISLYRWWAAVRGQRAPVQGQAEAP